MPRKLGLLRAASLAALTCGAVLSAGGAWAADPAAPDSKGASTVVPGVVITAERRLQNLQKAAISATVLDQKALEAKGVIGLTTLQFAAPGIQISDYSSANTFNIRGIGQSQVDIDLPSGVVIYRDGVPTLTGYFQNAPYYDLAGVEVLRGPQGTFVGKSASAGAVFIRTRDPELGHYGGEWTLGMGNYAFFEGTGVVNVPIGDTLAVRLAVHGEARNSLFDSIRSNPLPGGANSGGQFTGDDDRRLISARIGVLWEPNSHFSLVFKTDYDHLHFGSHATSGFNPATGLPEDISNPIINGHNFYTDKGVRSSLKMTYEFPDGIKLNSLSGFSTVKTRADWDVNGSNPIPFGFFSGGKFTNYSQEFNLLSPDSHPFRWVAGLFYQRYLNYVPAWPGVGFAFLTDNSTVPLLASPWQKNETNYAAFGQVAYDITPSLELQVGGRYGHYEFTQFTQFELFPTLFDIPFGDPPGGVHQKYSENSFDWKVNLNYQINPDQFVYGIISRGHTPGSINLFPNLVTVLHTAYKPMGVINYEAGWKGSWFDNQLRTQLAAYYQTFDNYQANFALLTNQIGPIDAIGEFKNARTTSKIYGVEFGAQGRFGELSYDLGLAFFQSKLGSFGVVVNPFFGVYGPPTLVLNGAKTPFAPEFTANAGVAYTFHLDQLASGMTATPRFDVAYRTDSFAQLFHNPSTILPAQALVNASLKFDDGPWDVTLWITNLADSRYAAAKQNVGVGGPDGFFNAPHIVGIVYMAPPRLFGVRVGRTF